ncbi:MAG: hypothetical protein K9N10_20440, partial [Deltaproteobacteria bacterium]|nr:hypothetical protein [Deltaproteobacteria bacterium]
MAGMIKSAPDPVPLLQGLFAWLVIVKIPHKKSSAFVITTKGFGKITTIMVPFMVFGLYLWPILVMADDHKRNGIHPKQYESGKGSFDSNDRKNTRLKSKDEGNELTGLATAWLLGAANFTVLI